MNLLTQVVQLLNAVYEVVNGIDHVRTLFWDEQTG